MQSLLLPAGLSSAATVGATPSLLHFRSRRQLCAPALPSPKLSSSFPFLSNSPLSYDPLRSKNFKFPFLVKIAGSPASTAYTSPPTDESERAKLAQVAKRLENTSRRFKRFGSIGFWGQLICTVVAAVILSFSIVATGTITSPVSFYTTSGGIVAAFISVFWSFGYIRLSERLRKTANDPSKAPPRNEVVKGLRNGIVLNLMGMAAAILGMQATVGTLVAKALTSSANPYYQGIAPGSTPVLALDVFLVQASANTILSHFLGLLFSLELLRSVTLPPSEVTPVPKLA
ncbi:Protein TIC 21, chloroplastic [Linum perenne]